MKDSCGCSGNFLAVGCWFLVVADNDTNILLLVCGVQSVAVHGITVLLVVFTQMEYMTLFNIKFHLPSVRLITQQVRCSLEQLSVFIFRDYLANLCIIGEF